MSIMSANGVAAGPGRAGVAPRVRKRGPDTVTVGGSEAPWPGNCDAVLAELCPVLFASLPRSDQRRTGAQYLQGLLGVRGRKSIRNLATGLGPQANEQSLHHFINSSTWDWTPMRRALGHYVMRAAPPKAWVVRPMVVPKAGQHSVGVDRRFFPALGQVVNAQQAIGVWASSGKLSAPVGWRLHLPRAWLEDMPRRNKALIPDELGAESMGDCAVEAVLELTRDLGLPARPVLLDAREADAVTIVRRLSAAGLASLVRIGGDLHLCPTEPVVAKHAHRLLPPEVILNASPQLRRPVTWTDHPAASAVRTSLVAAVRVTLPEAADAPNPGLVLLGVGAPRREWPAQLWLTDLVNAQPAALLWLSRLIERVDRDCDGVGARVGIRDFTGRSFGGWHRHMTLASAAHAVATVAAQTS